MRLSREESQARTRELLLEAARQAFARHGFGGASVGDIAEAAGFSKGAFYSNFKSKEAVLLELLRRHKTQDIAELQALLQACTDVASVLEALRRRFSALDQDADWAMLANELQLHAARTPSFAPEFDSLHQDNIEALGRLLSALFLKARRKPPAKLHDLAAGFIALVHGLALQHKPGADSPAGDLVALMLQSLLAAAEQIPSSPPSVRGRAGPPAGT